jgi:hypothetical protein
MGVLLGMYGDAGMNLESDYQKKRAEFIKARELYAGDKMDKMHKEIMRESKKSMDLAKEKMSSLLNTISESASKAASHLTFGNKVGGGVFSDVLTNHLSDMKKNVVSNLSESGSKIGSELLKQVKSL